MTTYDQEVQAKAIAEVEQLTAAFEEAQQALDRARDALQDAIVRHLRERNAPPGLIATASPYDRNHVGRIARTAGVEPLREPKPKARTRKRPAGGESSG
jgi:hypothetical protein